MHLIELSDKLDVIRMGKILGYFAQWDWSTNYYTILYLDKVFAIFYAKQEYANKISSTDTTVTVFPLILP
jgi:hypothetical protein